MFLKSSFLILIASFFSGDLAESLGKESGRISQTVKCGRDSVYLAMGVIGEGISLDGIDRLLGNRDEVNFQDISDMLQGLGIKTGCFRFAGSNIGLLSSRLSSQPGRVAAIVYFVDTDHPKGHFGLLTHVDNQNIEITDGQNLIIMPITNDSSFVTLLVSRSSSAVSFSRLSVTLDRVFLVHPGFVWVC